MPKKKPTSQDLYEAVKELRQEEQLPRFSEDQLTTFNSEYVDSYDEVHAVLDEKSNIHAKTKKGKNQSY